MSGSHHRRPGPGVHPQPRRSPPASKSAPRRWQYRPSASLAITCPYPQFRPRNSHRASTKYTISRAGSSRLRCSRVPVASMTSSTSSGGNALVRTPAEIRSGSHPSGGKPSAGPAWPCPGHASRDYPVAAAGRRGCDRVAGRRRLVAPNVPGAAARPAGPAGAAAAGAGGGRQDDAGHLVRHLLARLKALPWKDVPAGHASTGRAHGRIEKRTLKAVTVTESAGGPGFPGAAEAIQVIRRTRPVTPRPGKKARWCTETVYAIVTLPAGQASPAELATWIRQHWHIENKLHWVKDVTLGEDLHQARTGNGPQVLAVLRNLILSLLRLAGHGNIAAALRHHARHPDNALAMLTSTLTTSQ